MFPLPGPRAPKSRFPYISPPLGLWLRLRTGPGARASSGRWMVAGFSPPRRATPGTRAPKVPAHSGGCAGEELAPPYASLRDQPGGEGWKGRTRPVSPRSAPV